MARSSSSSNCVSLLFFLPRGGDTLCYFVALISILSLLTQHLSRCSALAADFEGFGDDDIEDDQLFSEDLPILSSPLPIPTTLTQSSFETDHGPPIQPANEEEDPLLSDLAAKPSSFEYWDEDEFEGLPVQETVETPKSASSVNPSEEANKTEKSKVEAKTVSPRSLSMSPKTFTVEIICVSFLVVFIINYFTGKKENENIALAWASKFATKDSIFEKNFSLLGTGDGKDTPLLLKEGQNVFKFYASGRRFCQGLLATMELQSRHDLISRVYNWIVPCKDEISFEVYMNDDAMDQVVFALAKKKVAKVMHKELRDLHDYGSLIPVGPSGRKWVVDDLMVVSESKEVAGDLLSETVLDQVFGDKAFEKFGKAFISMHISDRCLGSHGKMLLFKFALPDANHMADMTRLVALVPYYIDLIGRYKLSSQVRSKTDAARVKAAQEEYKEQQYARQEALQKKKLEKRQKMEEGEAKLSAEALRKREAKERARQMKKGAPKVKMTRAH
ncbi:hypothetical protein GIB67_026282 [Kingdonia uniflora]|uniref:Coiled-coil domain-containing protein 47 n=1 Tax=Kingdonia uniflora TaxID=39325 RepID=A0A7J7LA90_9MAGN|nr:hypothetical protein GIB67_026282 [Kingdonia uniflora]